MKTKAIRVLYKITIVLAFLVFGAMMWDYFLNDSELMLYLAAGGGVLLLLALIMLLLSPFDVEVRVETVQVGGQPAAPIEPEPTDDDEGIDYIGDVHEVVDLEGIGPAYADRLHQAGIYNTQQLLFADPRTIAAETGASPKTVQNWRAMAQLVKVRGVGPQYAEALVRAGIDGIEELRDEPAAAIAGAVQGYLDSLDSDVIGVKITPKRVASWQKAAKKLKRGPIDADDVKVMPLESKQARSDAAGA